MLFISILIVLVKSFENMVKIKIIKKLSSSGKRVSIIYLYYVNWKYFGKKVKL